MFGNKGKDVTVLFKETSCENNWQHVLRCQRKSKQGEILTSRLLIMASEILGAPN